MLPLHQLAPKLDFQRFAVYAEVFHLELHAVIG